MTEQTYLTVSELYCIPQEHYPLIVMSDNLRNIFSAGIKAHTHGSYGHMMWLIEPGVLASMQPNGFKKVKLQSFLASHRLKLWYSPDWTKEQRANILRDIKSELKEKWWQGNRYDFLFFAGQLLNLKWIQSPWADVCSEKDKYLKLADSNYDLKYASPEDVNRWLEAHQKDCKPHYEVYGRYTAD